VALRAPGRHPPGLVFTGLITLKSNAIIIALIALIATCRWLPWDRPCMICGCPTSCAHLLLFTYRYIYVFEQEYRRLVQAMKIRGFQPRTNLHTYRSYAYLAAMLLVRSFDRAERVFQAMLCRGFNGTFYSLRTFSWQRRDRLFSWRPPCWPWRGALSGVAIAPAFGRPHE
jgi:cobalt/nickel transport system permease protein